MRVQFQFPILAAAAAAAVLSACSSEQPAPPTADAAVQEADSGRDAMVPLDASYPDASEGLDAAPAADAQEPDAEIPLDASSPDASAGIDAAFAADAQAPPDAGAPDADLGPCGSLSQVESHAVCVPLIPCSSDADCRNDTRCDPAVGCVPWERSSPAKDPSCSSPVPQGVLTPQLRCEFSQPPPGDPFPAHVDVMSTPVVVNFNPPTGHGPPSLVAAFSAPVPGNYTEDLGVLRVLRGSDCSLEANLGGVELDGDGIVDWIVSSASPALGDLDGDGSAEVVAYGADGSTLAFTRKAGVWGLLWKAPLPAGAPWAACSDLAHRCPLGWAAPAIHDLDGDGAPEVLREGVVFGADGTLRSLQPADYTSYSQGLDPVAADFDSDGAVELTNGSKTWQWASGGWTLDPSVTGARPSPGHVAVADFGAFGTGIPSGAPELVEVSGSSVSIAALTGELAMPAVAVPGNGGGAPTIADFDGDGLPEVGTCGGNAYTVYDLDCGPSPRPGGVCSTGPCDFASGSACPAQGYLSWSRRSQDQSSNVTSSVSFDFDGDGAAEIVYGDECFMRFYDGRTGEVLFSQYRSSCTWYESPVVADLDGNSRAEAVVGSNRACAPAGQDSIACTMLDANGVDPLFAGLRCQTAADCVSGACDQGLCRCTAGADCCAAGSDAACLEQGLACAPPPAGTPGAGNTCRAAHPHGLSGIRVFGGARDQWMRARPVWNQPAYSVTNVNEDGTIPRTGDRVPSWSQPATNVYRANVSGIDDPLATGDLTAGPSRQFTCDSAGAALSAPVCNRGAEPVAAGLSVGFYVDGTRVCVLQTDRTIAAGSCETFGCTWDSPPSSLGDAVDVVVVPNDDGAYRECQTGNDRGTVLGVACPP